MKKITTPTKEEIIQYYIIECHSKKESCKHFQASATTFSRWLNKYNIIKTQEEMNSTKKLLYSDQQDMAMVIEKRKNTCMRKYGVENVSQSSVVKQKTKQTCLEKYGVEHVLQSDEIQSKIKNTCMEKYGVENPFQSTEIQTMIRKNMQTAYGCNSVQQLHIQNLDIWNSPELFKQYLNTLNIKPTVRDLMQFFNVSDVAIGVKAQQYNIRDCINFKPSCSRYEDEIEQYILSLGINNIERNNREILSGQEIDIFIPDYHIGIEFNGDYWHSDIYHTDHNGRTRYHQNKSIQAERAGIFLFHIFEYEWNNSITQQNIKNRLQVLLSQTRNKIAARNCTIIELSKNAKKQFLNDNHIQGNDHSTKQYGLLFNNELVACMSFVHPKNAKYTWELSRFCCKHDTIVQGGASKLFKYFISTLQSGDTISSYNDITKTKGNLYQTLGFQCQSINQPNYVWINFNTGDIRTRYQEQAGGEVDRMHNQGYHRVCDCGTKTWVYTVQ